MAAARFLADPPGSIYPAGQTITLTAGPDTGSAFVGWQGALSGDNPTEVLTLTRSGVVTATFEPQSVLLVLTVDGEGSIDGQPSRSAYRVGERVTLTAVAEPGWSFVRWSGAISGTSAVTTFTDNAGDDRNGPIQPSPPSPRHMGDRPAETS